MGVFSWCTVHGHMWEFSHGVQFMGTYESFLMVYNSWAHMRLFSWYAVHDLFINLSVYWRAFEWIYYNYSVWSFNPRVYFFKNRHDERMGYFHLNYSAHLVTLCWHVGLWNVENALLLHIATADISLFCVAAVANVFDTRHCCVYLWPRHEFICCARPCRDRL